MNTLRTYRPLRAYVVDMDELRLLSASLQDAVAKIGDFAFLKEQRRFAFVANRFVWECATGRNHGPFARVRSGVHFDDVLSVRRRNIRTDAPDAVVDLLAVQFTSRDDGAGEITLEFAGGGAIELSVEAINAGIRDISDPWRTRSRPVHGEQIAADDGL